MQEMTMKELERNLLLAYKMADVDPSKDTIASAVNKFSDRGIRHLTLYIENCGLLCLCSDPEMSKRFKAAIDAIDAELDLLDEQGKPEIDNTI